MKLQRIYFFNNIFKDKIETAIFFSVFLLEMFFGLYLVYLWGTTTILGDLLGGDLIAQLHISRTVVDNGQYSGLQNLGTVWLPLPNLLRVPFVMLDVLYTTGLAATIVNALLTAGTCVLLYRFVEERMLGIAAVALFLMNVFTVAMGVSPFQMPTAVFFMMLSFYYFKEYWEKDSMQDFVKCSLSVILATLSRYECWPVMVAIVFLFIIRALKNKRVYRLAYAHLPLWGVFAWLFWNLAIFRDPFKWLRGGGGGYASIASRAIAPQIQRVLTYSIPGMFRLSGLLIVSSLGPLILTLKRRDFGKIGVILVLLASLILVNMASWPGNERVLYAALLGIILTPLYMVRNRTDHSKYIVVALLFLMLSFALPSQYGIFIEAVYTRPSSPSPYSNELITLENTIGYGSSILTSSSGALSPGRSLSVIFGISPSKIIDEYDYKLFTEASNKPWIYADWVIIGKKSSYFVNILGLKTESDIKAFLEREHRDYGKHFLYLYYYDAQWYSDFIFNYKLLLETNNFRLYQRTGVQFEE